MTMRGTWQTTGPGRGTWQTGGGSAAGAVILAVAAVAAAVPVLAMAGAIAVAFLAAEAVAAGMIGVAWRLRSRAISRPVPHLVLSVQSQVGKSAPARELARGQLALGAPKPPGVTVALPAASYVRVDHQDQATGNANKTQQNKPLSMRNGPV